MGLLPPGRAATHLRTPEGGTRTHLRPCTQTDAQAAVPAFRTPQAPFRPAEQRRATPAADHPLLYFRTSGMPGIGHAAAAGQDAPIAFPAGTGPGLYADAHDIVLHHVLYRLGPHDHAARIRRTRPGCQTPAAVILFRRPAATEQPTVNCTFFQKRTGKSVETYYLYNFFFKTH